MISKLLARVLLAALPLLPGLAGLRLLLAGELDSAGTTHRVAAFAKQFERDFE